MRLAECSSVAPDLTMERESEATSVGVLAAVSLIVTAVLMDESLDGSDRAPGRESQPRVGMNFDRILVL